MSVKSVSVGNWFSNQQRVANAVKNLTDDGHIDAPALAAQFGAGAVGTGNIGAPKGFQRKEDGKIITTVKFDVKGLKSKNTANDIIGLVSTTPVVGAYIWKLDSATMGLIYKAELACLQTPAGGDPDIDLILSASATLKQDDAKGTSTHWFNNGDLAVGDVKTNGAYAFAAAYPYLYLASGAGAADAVYTAGQFILTMWGHPLLT